MQITRAGSQASAKGPDSYFTGPVRIDPLFKPQEPRSFSGALVTFEPGSRTNWHAHPAGQTLLVTAGIGWVQRDGGPIEVVRPGDVVWFPPGEKHWHGGSATVAMSHIALTEEVDGQVVNWLEAVTAEQYQAGPQPAEL